MRENLSNSRKGQKNLNEKLVFAILAALFAAIITALTAYFHIPAGHGYIHVGDAFIFLAACMLPTPYAVAASAIGGGLADILAGAPIWAPATIVIKSLLVFSFTSKSKKIINIRNICAIIVAMVITCAGYCVYDGLVFGQWPVAIAGIPDSIVQVGASGAIFIVLAIAIDASKLKTKLLKNFVK